MSLEMDECAAMKFKTPSQITMLRRCLRSAVTFAAPHNVASLAVGELDNSQGGKFFAGKVFGVTPNLVAVYENLE